MKSKPELKPLFLERMKKLLKNEEEYQKFLEILKIPPVKSIRCNTLKITPEELKERLEKQGWQVKQPWKKHPEVMIVDGKFAETKVSNMNKVNKKKSSKDNNEQDSNNQNTNYKDVKQSSSINRISKKSERQESRAIIPLEPGELGNSLEHLLGYYYIQELASMLPVIALQPKPNETILDLCASPGSKTTQIAACLADTGTIIANEINLGRIKILATNLERCGCSNVIITKKEGSALCKRLKKQNFLFDKILVDAPCSGEGTLRSNPKTYLMWNINTVKNLSRMQKNLISSAIEILKPNGEIVYSTCTHAPEENEEVVDFIINKFKDEIKIEDITLPIKCRQGIANWYDKSYVNDAKYSCRIYPQDNNTEGFFIAKFKKNDR